MSHIRNGAAGRQMEAITLAPGLRLPPGPHPEPGLRLPRPVVEPGHPVRSMSRAQASAKTAAAVAAGFSCLRTVMADISV